MDRDETKHTLALSNILWTAGELSYKFDSLQNSINDTVLAAYPRAKQICVLSSRQIGKSYWALCFALMYLIRNPGSIVRLLAPTKSKAYELIEDNLLPIMADCPDNFLKKIKTQLRWNVHNGSSLRIGPLEGAHVDSNRSGNAKLVIYEECGFVSSDEFDYARRSVIGPQLLRSNGHEIFVTSPSKDPQHSLHNIILPECDILGTLFRYTIWDSPSLSKDQIEEAARRSGGFESEDFQREYEAKIIRSFSLMVIPKLNEKLTFASFPVPDDYLDCMICTGDWGGVMDKTYFCIHWYEPNNNLTFVIDELIFEPNTGTAIIAPQLQEWKKKYRLDGIWCDLPGQVGIDLANDYGVIAQMPPKDDWVGAVNTLAARFALDLIRIDRDNCPFLFKSVLGGMFNKGRTSFVRSRELGHCDALAALCYANRVQHLAANAQKVFGRRADIKPEAIEAMRTPAVGKYKTDVENSYSPSLRNIALSKNPGWSRIKGRS